MNTGSFCGNKLNRRLLMTSQDTKEPKEEPTWDFICEQIGKERFTPKRNHHFGVNLTENRHRRKKEDAKT